MISKRLLFTAIVCLIVGCSKQAPSPTAPPVASSPNSDPVAEFKTIISRFIGYEQTHTNFSAVTLSWDVVKTDSLVRPLQGIFYYTYGMQKRFPPSTDPYVDKREVVGANRRYRATFAYEDGQWKLQTVCLPDVNPGDWYCDEPTEYALWEASKEPTDRKTP